jgi:adenosylhomocysteine nucleosidase
MDISGVTEQVVIFHTGWGKVAAASSTQYVIDAWSPDLIVNLGTCGGFDGAVQRRDVILVNCTIVYDIVDRIGDPKESIAKYVTNLDLTWLGERYSQKVIKGPMLTADRDLAPSEVGDLRSSFGAVAADWESGSIAYVAIRNKRRCLILRGVSDLVSQDGGEAYGKDGAFYRTEAQAVMSELMTYLPSWLQLAAIRPPGLNKLPRVGPSTAPKLS